MQYKPQFIFYRFIHIDFSSFFFNMDYIFTVNTGLYIVLKTEKTYVFGLGVLRILCTRTEVISSRFKQNSDKITYILLILPYVDKKCR
jgi:hypothetical protein